MYNPININNYLNLKYSSDIENNKCKTEGKDSNCLTKCIVSDNGSNKCISNHNLIFTL